MKSDPIWAVAREELSKWDRSKTVSRGVAMAILFAFIHRLTTGESLEETYPSAQSDYEI